MPDDVPDVDPHDDRYLDEADVRLELTRVFDVCHGCRRCVDLCPSFPALFEMIDQHGDGGAGLLTPAQQDAVVGLCHQCQRCALDCPYRPGLHESRIDVPRLMVRAEAMRREHGHLSIRRRTADRLLARTGLVGAVVGASAGIANRLAGAPPGSPVRRVLAATTGVSAVRLFPPSAKQRFSTWFRSRPAVSIGEPQGAVTIFPSCNVEYHEPAIGKDLVGVYERNGVECGCTTAGCCGASLLRAGDVAGFVRIAERNVEVLAAEVRAGTDVVVPQPACGYVLKQDYPRYVGGADAEVVAQHTFDAAEYLMRLHRSDTAVLDTTFDGTTLRSIAYHAPCHLLAQDVGLPSRDVLKLTGAQVTVVQRCAGVEGGWGLRAENDDVAVPMARRLGEAVAGSAADAAAGDCHSANTVIAEQTGRSPVHPLQVLARAYGIAEEA